MKVTFEVSPETIKSYEFIKEQLPWATETIEDFAKAAFRNRFLEYYPLAVKTKRKKKIKAL